MTDPRRTRVTLAYGTDGLDIEVPEDATVVRPAHHPAVPVEVAAVRVDRSSREESTLELSPGPCGRDVGPFFTSAVGDGVMVAWTERAAFKPLFQTGASDAITPPTWVRSTAP